jgi:hypothetical protein
MMNHSFIAREPKFSPSNGTITTENNGIGYYSHDIALVKGAIVERD